jgi:hypothetical protein
VVEIRIKNSNEYRRVIINLLQVITGQDGDELRVEYEGGNTARGEAGVLLLLLLLI